MQNKTRTRIQIPGTPTPGQPHRVATVSGTAEACEQVRQMIERIIMEQSSNCVMSPSGGGYYNQGYGGGYQQQQQEDSQQEEEGFSAFQMARGGQGRGVSFLCINKNDAELFGRSEKNTTFATRSNCDDRDANDKK